MKPTYAEALEQFTEGMGSVVKALDESLGKKEEVKMRKLDGEDAIYSLMIKPLATQVQELREYGLTEANIWQSVQLAFEAGIRKFNESEEKADAGH